jgi:hypothetical protein
MVDGRLDADVVAELTRVVTELSGPVLPGLPRIFAFS